MKDPSSEVAPAPVFDRRHVTRVVAVLPLMALSTCAACPGEETLDEEPGPPAAQLVRVHGFHGRGRLGGVDDYAELRIASSPDHAVYVCDEPKSGTVKVEPGGRRVAARCDEGPWTIMWLAQAGRMIRLCGVPDDPSQNWAEAPSPLSDPVRAVECAGSTQCSSADDCTFARVLEEIQAAGDQEALERLVTGTTDLFELTLDAWTEAWGTLAEPARTRVKADLCRAVGDPEANPIRMAHAMLVCDWDSELSPDALERALELVSKREPKPLDGSRPLRQWAVAALAHTRPAAAVHWACTLLQQGDATLLTVLATSEEPCEALRAASEPGYSYCCDGAPCTPQALEDLVSRTIAGWRDHPVPRKAWVSSAPGLTANVAFLAAMERRQLPSQHRCTPAPSEDAPSN